MSQSNEIPKDEENDFEIVSENELVFAERGRKSNISEKDIEMVRNLLKKNPTGWVKFNKLAIPTGMTDKKEIANVKAKNSAHIRGIGTKMNMKARIRWDKGMTPAAYFVKVTK